MTSVRGTLSTRGWLYTPEARLDRMLEEYVLANPSQTLFYRGRIRSLIATIRLVGTDPDKLATAIREDLSAKAAINFPERDGGRTEVVCQLDPVTNDINIEISMTVYFEGKMYSLNQVLANASSYAQTTDAVIM